MTDTKIDDNKNDIDRDKINVSNNDKKMGDLKEFNISSDYNQSNRNINLNDDDLIVDDNDDDPENNRDIEIVLSDDEQDNNHNNEEDNNQNDENEDSTKL